MISSKEVQLHSPIFAPKRVKDLMSIPEKGLKNLKPKKVDSESWSLSWSINRVVKEGLTGSIGSLVPSEILSSIEKISLEKKQLTKEAKYLIDLMLVFSLNADFSFSKVNKDRVLKILDLFKNDDKNFDWFYKRVTSYLSESQLGKLQEAYLGRRPKDKKIDFKSKKKIVAEIIKLFNGNNKVEIVNKKDPVSFLGLDNAAMEAVCWKELEMHRSGNSDFARLAGTIAWKNWLFKEPILKEFCLKNGYEYDSLSFIQKTNLTKQAVKHFSSEERAMILDKAVEAELNRRKKTLKVETNPKFINKRVSLGIELEMNGLSAELAIIYAWYENLDRSLVGDSIAFNKEIDVLFKQLGQSRDQKELINRLKPRSLEIVQIIERFKGDLTEQEQADLKRQIYPIIAELPDKEMKKQLKLWLKNNPLSLDILELIQGLWKNMFNAVEASFSESRENFRSSLTKARQEPSKYNSQSNGFAAPLPDDYPDIAHKLLDAFKHHMGQVQALGHKLGKDAFGEYSLEYTSGNFKDPYRFNLRETWELAKTSFHNLDVNNRPMHVTIGWKEDAAERGILISSQLIYKESSLMNFALMSTGWANRNFINEFKKKNELKLAKEGQTAVINSYSDSGKDKFIISRGDGGAGIYGVEFRGFSPAPGMDQARLFSSLGTLGTAMKAYVIVENDSHVKGKIDAVDQRLHGIWQKFREEVESIYDRSGIFPELFEANSWKTSRYSETLTNYYLKMAEDLDKDEGMVTDMRELIQKTINEIDQVFNPTHVKKRHLFTKLFERIGLSK